MGNLLKQYKFNILSNPFGTLYNPISLSQWLIDDLDESAILEQKGVHYHWQAHSEVSSLTKKGLDELVRERRKLLQEKLKTADWLIITLGSAFSYRLKSSGKIVANCHKVPQTEFTKELLTLEEMTAQLSRAFEKLASANPKLKIIFTVSPVRHVKDGLIENNWSKARLIEVAHSLCLNFDHIQYFPAYEIMIDELRDYRFYAKDRVHPSDEAMDYIWQKFGESCFDYTTNQFIKDWSQVRSAINHRPFHVESKEHQAFIRTTIAKLNALANQVDVSEELSLMERQLL